MKGIYCLKIKCKNSIKIKVGKLGDINFKAGSYLYIGSAANGIESRVLRHLGKDKKIFWHIDYLLSDKDVEVKYVYFLNSSWKIECDISRELSFITLPVKGFGSSDCKCKSHLFLFSKDILNSVEKLLTERYRFKKLTSFDFIEKFK